MSESIAILGLVTVSGHDRFLQVSQGEGDSLLLSLDGSSESLHTDNMEWSLVQNVGSLPAQSFLEMWENVYYRAAWFQVLEVPVPPWMADFIAQQGGMTVELETIRQALTPPEETPQQRLSRCSSLEELLAQLEELHAEAEEEEDPRLRLHLHHRLEQAVVDLPTYGGARPARTEGVWSWDQTRLLVGEGGAEMLIVFRDELVAQLECAVEEIEEISVTVPPHARGGSVVFHYLMVDGADPETVDREMGRVFERLGFAMADSGSSGDGTGFWVRLQ